MKRSINKNITQTMSILACIVLVALLMVFVFSSMLVVGIALVGSYMHATKLFGIGFADFTLAITVPVTIIVSIVYLFINRNRIFNYIFPVSK